MNFQHNPTNQLYQNLPLIRSVSKYLSSGSCHQSSSLHYCFYFTTSVSQELYLKKIKYLHFASKHILIHIINGKKRKNLISQIWVGLDFIYVKWPCKATKHFVFPFFSLILDDNFHGCFLNTRNDMIINEP